MEFINSFFQRDEMSYPLPGTKDKESVEQQDGKRINVLKRLLLYDVSECHQLCLSEENDKIGLTKFGLLRPPFVVLAGSSGTYVICICVRHQNQKL